MVTEKLRMQKEAEGVISGVRPCSSLSEGQEGVGSWPPERPGFIHCEHGTQPGNRWVWESVAKFPPNGSLFLPAVCGEGKLRGLE